MSWLLRILVLALVLVPDLALAEAAGDPLAQEAPVIVTTRLTPESSNVGDLLKYEVTASFPKGITVNLPAVLKFDPLYLVGVNDPEPEPTGEKLRKVFVIELQHFAVGEARVPGFPLTYVDKQGQVQTVDVPPYTFSVDAVLANEAEPTRRGEDPPVSPEYPNTLAELIIYAVMGAIVLALILVVVLRRIAARERPVYVPPPIPAHEVALEALAKLKEDDLLGRGEFINYYLQLTEIAKGYLEGRFGVEALDQTTDEIRSTLLRDPDKIKPLTAEDVVTFLERCDLVKFARFQPPDDEASEAAHDVRSMVERTLPANGGVSPATKAEPKVDASPSEEAAS